MVSFTAVTERDRNYSGFHFFDDQDQRLFELIARGGSEIHGFQNKNLRRHLADKSGAQISRLLKRIRLHGLVKKVTGTYRYYLTKLGRLVMAAGLKLKGLFLVPEPVAVRAK